MHFFDEDGKPIKWQNLTKEKPFDRLKRRVKAAIRKAKVKLTK